MDGAGRSKPSSVGLKLGWEEIDKEWKGSSFSEGQEMDVGLQKLCRRRDEKSQVRLHVWEKMKQACADGKGTKEMRGLRESWRTG